MADTAPTVIVEEKSSFLSKINWTAVVTVVFTMLTAFGINIPDDLKINILAAISAISSVVIIVWKTWFTTTVTPSSAAKL